MPLYALDDIHVPDADAQVWRILRELKQAAKADLNSISADLAALRSEVALLRPLADAERARREREAATAEIERLERLRQSLTEDRSRGGPRPAPSKPRPSKRPSPRAPREAGALPALATWQERVLWLAEQRAGTIQPNVVRSYALRSTLKLPTCVALAEAYAVPPRWLAFGETDAGGDAGGVGARLRTARQVRAVGYRVLAARTGTGQNSAYYVERGHNHARQPMTTSLDSVVKWAEALDVAPGWLAFGGAGAPSPAIE